MADTTIWKEISKIKNQRRKIYFMWKNGIENIKVNYGSLTEDEFIEKCNRLHNNPIRNREVFFNYMKIWESSPEYKRLLFLLKEDNFATDLLEIYNTTKDKAKEGDSQAIKNVLLLQKEIKKYRQSIDEFQQLEEETEEDDGLTI